MVDGDILIFDIETRTFGKPDSNKDILKIFGCYSYITKRYYILTNIQDIQTIINKHKYLVGFNIKGYDIPILKRTGIKVDFKYLIDLREVFKKRAGEMKVGNMMLKDEIMIYSLDYITRLIKIVDDDTSKKEIDYSMFKKDVWTKEELEEITKYAKRDVEVTKKLYEWCEDYFSGFKSFINEKDVKAKKYITDHGAAFSYKAICKAMNWEPTMADTDKHVTLKGGYVAYPAGERFEGNIYCLDFNSLYPHITIQCDLYGRKKENKLTDNRDVWYGGNVWKVDGTYYADELSPVCKLFKQWYKERDELKKIEDKKEYSIKIILNIGSYGILNNPYYDKVFDEIAGRDCPAIGRQWTKYARKIFLENGYTNIYSDTDSCYIYDPFDNKEKLLKVKDKIIEYIKTTVPFPQDTFDMGVDDEIKYMWFFRGGNKDKEDDDMDPEDKLNKPKGFMKKNYIYLAKIFKKNEKGEMIYTGKDKVVIKNLGIKKKSISPLSKKIFWEYLVPHIKKGKIKFGRAYIRQLIRELLSKDFKLAALRKDVGEYKQYEAKSPNSLPAQIAKKYGSGIHFMIPNNKGIGVGKGKQYCTIEEFNKRKLMLHHIDLSNVWKELEYFIKANKVVTIFDFGKK